MTVILLNLVTGPPLFHAAIVAAGEARALQLPGLAGDAAGAPPRTPSLPKSASKCALSPCHLQHPGAGTLRRRRCTVIALRRAWAAGLEQRRRALRYSL